MYRGSQNWTDSSIGGGNRNTQRKLLIDHSKVTNQLHHILNKDGNLT